MPADRICSTLDPLAPRRWEGRVDPPRARRPARSLPHVTPRGRGAGSKRRPASRWGRERFRRPPASSTPSRPSPSARTGFFVPGQSWTPTESGRTMTSRHRCSWVWVLLGSLAGTAGRIAGQVPGELTGHLSDARTARPIDGAHVEITGWPDVVISAPDGSFALRGLEPRAYTLRVRA